MVMKQCLLDFKIPPDIQITEDDIIEKISTVLHKHLNVSDPVSIRDFHGFGKMLVYEPTKECQCTVRILPDGLLMLDIFYHELETYQRDKEYWNFSPLRESVEESLFAKTSAIPPIKRGREIHTYYETSDGRLKEYDFDRVVHQEKSEFQDILILHSPQFGNMLFLDNTEMLAESDIAYTRAITGNGSENFKDKTVLILGGGDGGIIHELMKENPKFVTMVEIDSRVIDIANKYLSGICGSTLASMEGPNHKIVVLDCVKYLRECVQDGRTFDYVINDLTDVPIMVQIQDSHWDLLRTVQNLSLQVLAPDGKYYAQGTNGALNYEALKTYEEQLKQACCPIEFTKNFVFVPSFLELWTIYKVWKTPLVKNSIT